MNAPNRIIIRVTGDEGDCVEVELSYNEWKQKYALSKTLADFNKLSAEDQEKVQQAEWVMLNQEIPNAILESDHPDLEVTDTTISEVLEMEDFLPQVKDLIKKIV